MKVLAVAATKGGVGKSTLTCAVAVAAQADGQRVAIIDTDPQGSTRDWHELRGSPEWPRLIKCDSVAQGIAAARKIGCDLVVVDTPPSVINIIEPVVSASDAVLIAVRASPVDLLAIDVIAGLAEDYHKPFVFVVNAVPPRTAYALEASKHLRQFGKVLSATVGHRNAFAMAMAAGKTGAEVDGKAREEIEVLWAEIRRFLRGLK